MQVKNIYSGGITDQPYNGEMLKDRVRQRRKELGLTQVQLAKAAGIRQPSLSNIEKGQTHGLKGDTLMRLAAALGVDAEYLRTGRRAIVAPTGSSGVADALFLQLSPANQSVWLEMGKILLVQQSEVAQTLHNTDSGRRRSPNKQVNQDRTAAAVLHELTRILDDHGPDAFSRALDALSSAASSFESARPKDKTRS